MAIPASIEQFLKGKGILYTILRHPAAYTAQEEAAMTHVPGRKWAKTVVCFAGEEPVLALLPAHFTVDLNRLQDLAGPRKLRLAHEDEFATLYPECEAGSMPPFGPLYQQRVFVDKNLTADPEIVFHGGTHSDAIRMRYIDFVALVHPVVGEFARPPGGG